MSFLVCSTEMVPRFERNIESEAEAIALAKKLSVDNDAPYEVHDLSKEFSHVTYERGELR